MPISAARGLRGIADPPDSESGSLGRASRLAPTIFKAPKALSAMYLLGKQASLVQFRVGAPFPLIQTQSSQRSSRFHKPAVSRAALETATIYSWRIGRDRNSCRHGDKILRIEAPPGYKHAFASSKRDLR